MTKILVDVDDRILAKAAAKLGTKTKKDTIGRALEIAARDSAESEARSRDWDAWADSLSERIAEVDWDQAWS
jgi:Arc/MetJ family transcription regulator